MTDCRCGSFPWETCLLAVAILFLAASGCEQRTEIDRLSAAVDSLRSPLPAVVISAWRKHGGARVRTVRNETSGEFWVEAAPDSLDRWERIYP